MMWVVVNDLILFGVMIFGLGFGCDFEVVM